MTDVKSAYLVYEIYRGGLTLGELVAERHTFDDALAVATAAAQRSRVIVHMGAIIWPRVFRSKAEDEK